MNCQTKPSLPSCHTYAFMSSVVRPAASQLNDGLRLYASHCFGYTAWTPCANSVACARIGFFVSIQRRSEYGANAIARFTAHCVPPW